MGRPAKDITGLRFGYLTATRRVGSLQTGTGLRPLWEVRCDCGRVKQMVSSIYCKGEQKSCGCQRYEIIASVNRTHGMSRHPAYWVWRSMVDRCKLPTHQAWANYGGRGITVCPEWQSFETFWADMGPTYRRGLALERKDNAAGYSPANCEWATHRKQANNRRGNVYIPTWFGPITVAEASRLTGIGHTTLLYRLSVGADPSTMLSTPDLGTALSSRVRKGHS